MSTNNTRRLPKPMPVRPSTTGYLIPKSTNLRPGEYYGETSHYRIDTNTVEAVCRAFCQWSRHRDNANMVECLSALLPNVKDC